MKELRQGYSPPGAPPRIIMVHTTVTSHHLSLATIDEYSVKYSVKYSMNIL